MFPLNCKILPFVAKFVGVSLSLPLLAQVPVPAPLAPPPQEEGLPYTRSSIANALKFLGRATAVMAGSRYGYIDGRRVRLSGSDLLRAEAFERDGKTFVPVECALLLGPARLEPAPVPPDLTAIADRWVYAPSEWKAGVNELPEGVTVVEENGSRWAAFEDVAKAFGLEFVRLKSGVVLAGERLPQTDASEAVLESVVTLFDTPEKFSDPSIATRHIPNLKRQGPWTDHVKVTADQLALVEGPGTDWQTAPPDTYDMIGVNMTLFGSKVPPPGVYPRLFFSPDDLPALRKRVGSTVSGQKSLIEMEDVLGKTWFNPKTDDGRLFEKLATGDLEGLEWEVPAGKPSFAIAHHFKGFKSGVYASHIAYVPECLTAISLYALLKDDAELGRKAASALSNYYKLLEPLVDEFLKISDSEFGSSLRMPDGMLVELNALGARTHWRNIHGLVAHQNLAQSMDFGGYWMTPEQRDGLRRLIAKATYGRRSHGQDGPIRFRDVNWMAWDLPHFLAVASIEGLPGFDPEAYQSGKESARAFCQWGVDPDGVIYESNGKSAGALQFQLLSMVTAARRGGDNLFGHPHWRRLLEGQVQMTSPDGRVIVNSGTQYGPHSREKMSMSFVNQFKSFYPESRLADYLLTTALERAGAPEIGSPMPDPAFDTEAYRQTVAASKRTRLPSAGYPGFVRNVLFDSDVVPTQRKDLGLPLNFNAPVHGVFSAYSSAETDAAWMNMMVRPNHYIGAGHHHADAGMFHFSALGVNWITESPFTQWYTGNVHNLVQVDGLSQPDGIDGVVNGYNAAANYLGANLGETAASASADLTYAYSWRWNTQPPQIWPEAGNLLGWEMDPSPGIAKIFAGTARYKLRPWWSNYTFGNYIATSRAAFNPMEYVFRTTGLVRGSHPFGFVVDDVKKDNKDRLYQWVAMLNGGVWQANVGGLPANAIALATTGKDSDVKVGGNRPPLEPKPGDPLLLVYALGMKAPAEAPLLVTENVAGQASRKGEPQFMDRLVINHRGSEAAFRILLLPVRTGEPLPEVTYDAAKGVAKVTFGKESSDLTFAVDSQSRSKTSVTRDRETILEDDLATPPAGTPPGA